MVVYICVPAVSVHCAHNKCFVYLLLIRYRVSAWCRGVDVLRVRISAFLHRYCTAHTAHAANAAQTAQTAHIAHAEHDAQIADASHASCTAQ